MKEDQRNLLVLLGKPPARLTAEQTACILNCAAHDIPVLVAARLLKPLGDPAPNGTKYFATQDVLGLAGDRNWLNRITSLLQQHWRHKNTLRASFGDRQDRCLSPLVSSGPHFRAKGSR